MLPFERRRLVRAGQRAVAARLAAEVTAQRPVSAPRDILRIGRPDDLALVSDEDHDLRIGQNGMDAPRHLGADQPVHPAVVGIAGQVLLAQQHRAVTFGERQHRASLVRVEMHPGRRQQRPLGDRARDIVVADRDGPDLALKPRRRGLVVTDMNDWPRRAGEFDHCRALLAIPYAALCGCARHGSKMSQTDVKLALRQRSAANLGRISATLR